MGERLPRSFVPKKKCLRRPEENLWGAGNSILDAGGAPIQLDPRNGPPTIAPDGRILDDGLIVGNIGVFQVPQESLIGRYTNSAFFTDRPGVPVAPGSGNSISQGFIETSNVNPLKELAHLIAVQKVFTNASQMLDRADRTLAKSVTELGGR